MKLSSHTKFGSGHHRRWMERLPIMEKPTFDTSPFIKTCFEVWEQSNPARMGEPFLAVQPLAGISFDGVGSLLRKHDANLAALITAWNPGRLESADYNQAANQRLLEALQGSGLAVYPARGTALAGDWFEDSYLVVGGTYNQYLSWQKMFEQLAFVVFRTDGAVELRW